MTEPRDAAPGIGLSPLTTDTAKEFREAVKSLSRGTVHDSGHQGATSSRHSTTSDLSIDEALLLHSVGWEALELVCGVSMVSIPVGAWNWGTGEITWATQAETTAMASAAERLAAECAKAGGTGVVGVEVDVQVYRHHVEVGLVGTAIRPVGRAVHTGRPFVSDLSGKDFALLDQAGWFPVGIAFGTSFVYAPRRSAGTVIRQKSQNIELTNFTEALYQARESAMERMQSSALSLAGDGVVAVHIQEGPMQFAHHAIAFTAWGTTIKLGPSGHRGLSPKVVLSMNDSVIAFEAGSLRAG